MLEGPRAVLNQEELEGCVTLANQVFYPDGSGNMGGWFPTLFSMENAANLRIHVDNGYPVAMAGFIVRDAMILGSRHRCALVGSVCTAAQYQGKGLASTLMEDVVERSREQGAELMLISGSRQLYRRMGSSDAGLFRVVHVQKGAPLPALDFTVAQWREAEIPEMASLHQAESVHLARSAEEMEALLRTRVLHCKPSRTWTVSRRAAVSAYMCVQEPMEENGITALRVREFAGSRLSLLAGLARLFAEYPSAERIDIDTISADFHLWDCALTYGYASEARGFLGTVKILDAARFVDSLQGYIAERLPREEVAGLSLLDGERIRMRFAGEELVFSSDAEAAAFIFGTVERRPAPQIPRAIAGVCAKLFPMPLVDYGLSYI